VPCHSSISMAIIKSNLSLFKNCRVPCHPSILMVIIKSNLSFFKPCLIPAYLWLCEMFHSYLHLRSSLKKWWRSPTTAKQNNLSEKSNSTPSSTHSLHRARFRAHCGARVNFLRHSQEGRRCIYDKCLTVMKCGFHDLVAEFIMKSSFAQKFQMRYLFIG
jgi:hypothetical protein